MVQQLISQIIERLRSGFAGVITNPATRILDGPAPVPTIAQVPRLALYMGTTAFEQQYRDQASSQPRPMEMRQTLPFNLGLGPYQLAQTPLDKSMLCKVQFSQAVGGRRRLFQEGKDFTIDYQNARLSFIQEPNGAETMSLKYSYVGVFTVREFQQDFFLDIFDDSAAKVENWATLSTAMILSNHDELLNDFNINNPLPHIANEFVSEHTLSHVLPINTTVEKLPGSDFFKLQMKFNANGQVKYIRTQLGGFGIIEKIQSPGVASAHPVDIDIELE